jgi:hypothetical protein
MHMLHASITHTLMLEGTHEGTLRLSVTVDIYMDLGVNNSKQCSTHESGTAVDAHRCGIIIIIIIIIIIKLPN